MLRMLWICANASSWPAGVRKTAVPEKACNHPSATESVQGPGGLAGSLWATAGRNCISSRQAGVYKTAVPEKACNHPSATETVQGPGGLLAACRHLLAAEVVARKRLVECKGVLLYISVARPTLSWVTSPATRTRCTGGPGGGLVRVQPGRLFGRASPPQFLQ